VGRARASTTSVRGADGRASPDPKRSGVDEGEFDEGQMKNNFDFFAMTQCIIAAAGHDLR
jgi:hypothetical protein